MGHKTATPGAATSAGLVALVIGALVLWAKAAAWKFTGSTAILGETLESAVNVAVSVFALLALAYASRPPDANHPYGHGKLEFVVAAFEGGLVLVAGALVVATLFGADALPLTRMGDGAAVVLGGGLVNGGLGLWMLREGKRRHSPVLTGDGHHLVADFWTSVGVAGAASLVAVTGWRGIDSIAAGAIALHLLVVGVRLIRHALSGLLDEADPALLSTFAEHVAAVRGPWILEVHHARALRVGRRIHIDAHVVVPGTLTLVEAHDEVQRLERDVARRWGRDLEVAFHVDPCREGFCGWCPRPECPYRRAGPEGLLEITPASIVSGSRGRTDRPSHRLPDHPRNIH